jgi:3-dehydroquinate synthase
LWENYELDMSQKLIFTNEVNEALAQLIEQMQPQSLWVVADSNTRPILHAHALTALSHAHVIEILPSDTHKSLEAMETVWRAMTEGGATRRAVVVNLGGGMVTDLGGFAAATFKRGVRFINVPTTLLGAVDAAVGGKTGINFLGYKNEIGAFAPADAVVISTRFFATLPRQELLSGFAEMLKHGLISSADVYGRLLDYDIAASPLDALLPLLQESVEVKERIVAEDPREQGIRRALNLGHTAGHAFESRAMQLGQPVAHGVAVAHGLLVEMVLSHMILDMPSRHLYDYAALLAESYGTLPSLTCSDYDALLQLMHHDKKNVDAAHINFTLLHRPGAVEIDCTATEEQIRAALDIYRDLMHV